MKSKNRGLEVSDSVSADGLGTLVNRCVTCAICVIRVTEKAFCDIYCHKILLQANVSSIGGNPFGK